MLYYLLLVLALVFNSAANILIKVGVNRIGDISEMTKLQVVAGYLTNPFTLGGMAIFAGNIFLYMAALSRINVSVAYPIVTAGAFIVITTVSVLFLKETLDAVQAFGLFLMVAGIVIVSARS